MKFFLSFLFILFFVTSNFAQSDDIYFDGIDSNYNKKSVVLDFNWNPDYRINFTNYSLDFVTGNYFYTNFYYTNFYFYRFRCSRINRFYTNWYTVDNFYFLNSGYYQGYNHFNPYYWYTPYNSPTLSNYWWRNNLNRNWWYRNSTTNTNYVTSRNRTSSNTFRKNNQQIIINTYDRNGNSSYNRVNSYNSVSRTNYNNLNRVNNTTNNYIAPSTSRNTSRSTTTVRGSNTYSRGR